MRGVTDAKEIEREQLLAVVNEAFALDPALRHFAIVGKEPTESPEELLAILKRWHGLSKECRPGSIGMITSGLGIPCLTCELVQTPLSWVLVSVDDAQSTGLRTGRIASRGLENALLLHKAGGVELVAVNTVFTGGNLEALSEIGKILAREKVDQWGIGSFLAIERDAIKATVSVDDLAMLVAHLVRTFGQGELPIVLDLSREDFDALCVKVHAGEQSGSWRYEVSVESSQVKLTTFNRSEPFLRVRYDGMLLGFDEVLQKDLETSKWGRYTLGAIKFWHDAG